MVRGTLTPAKKTQPINQYEYQSWKLCTELGESPIDTSDPETLPPIRVHLDNFNTRRITEALHTGVLTKDFAHKNWPTTQRPVEPSTKRKSGAAALDSGIDDFCTKMIPDPNARQEN